MSVSGKKWSDTSPINPVSESCGGREPLNPFNQLTGTSDRVYWPLIGSSRRAFKNQVSRSLRLICWSKWSKLSCQKLIKLGFDTAQLLSWVRIQVMGVWNSSKQTVHDIIPVFLLLSLSTNSKVGNNHLSKQMDSSHIGMSMRQKLYVHFNITRLLVVAERASELRIQISRHLLLRRGLSFGLATTHCAQTEAGL